jgi:hypothetical protein
MTNVINVDFAARRAQATVKGQPEFELNRAQALMLTAVGAVADDETLIELAAAAGDAECYQQATNTVQLLVDIFYALGQE